ncbi:hypothetical protein FISHEDRAFT_78836 [Fistulina hepatica ATCC 64428]|uniref:Cation-transporting P-type ATPase C-terminal domain-containing protein n=1 Tax=Fistulina hepatica ATCC 64428 TaxID=1128425 RepID=A0A0D6ZZ42_9AGAR|nr:hypothetical protein FISHEDRAFT_78836 [Fistulina hepatica ATCC 64428]
MTGDRANDSPALSHANVHIAVEGATDTVRGAADNKLEAAKQNTIQQPPFASNAPAARVTSANNIHLAADPTPPSSLISLEIT